MTIMVCKPNEPPYSTDIEGTLEEMQALVGGYIEPVNVQGDVLILANEEGLIYGLPPNRFNLVGTFFFIARAGSEFRGLTDTEIHYCLEVTAGWDSTH